jgi:hypothetical protein
MGALRRQLPLILEDSDMQLSGFFREMLGEMAERFKLVDQRIRQYDLKVENVFGRDDLCHRLARVKGVGVLAATALAAAMGNAHEFKNGRELSVRPASSEPASNTGPLEADYVIEVKKRGFHQDQDSTPGSTKRSDICEQPASPTVCRQPCAEAGVHKCYMGDGRGRGFELPSLNSGESAHVQIKSLAYLSQKAAKAREQT